MIDVEDEQNGWKMSPSNQLIEQLWYILCLVFRGDQDGKL